MPHQQINLVSHSLPRALSSLASRSSCPIKEEIWKWFTGLFLPIAWEPNTNNNNKRRRPAHGVLCLCFTFRRRIAQGSELRELLGVWGQAEREPGNIRKLIRYEIFFCVWVLSLPEYSTKAARGISWTFSVRNHAQYGFVDGWRESFGVSAPLFKTFGFRF